jgi:bacterial microcompartment shell protein
MQTGESLGLVEFSSLAKGIETADAMCKSAGVKLLKSISVSRGKQIVIVCGPLGEVETAMKTAICVGENFILEKYTIQNVHKDVFSAISKKHQVKNTEAVGIVETKNVIPAIFAADSACKSSKVDLVEIKLGLGIGGKGYFSLTGEVGSVRTAISAGINSIGQDKVLSKIVISQAHEHVLEAL